MPLTGLRKEKPFEDLRRSSQKLVARLKAEVKIRADGKPEPLQEWQQKGRKLVAKIQAEMREARIDDEARFLKTWFDKPLVTGAVSPSSKALARKMASYVEPESIGPVVELGPGTGPVTEALIARGVAEERLVLVEYNPAFCALLAKRYPRATIVQGDAYALETVVAPHLKQPAAAVVSSLPLFTKPEKLRLALLDSAFSLLAPGAPFIQFTYAAVSPMPRKGARFEAHVSPRVWKNLPPACVWVYRKLQA
jgi:phosphatidylethanolamine/phosphatidyl-N-methylethanolamine N-methyltransferase